MHPGSLESQKLLLIFCRYSCVAFLMDLENLVHAELRAPLSPKMKAESLAIMRALTSAIRHDFWLALMVMVLTAVRSSVHFPMCPVTESVYASEQMCWS